MVGKQINNRIRVLVVDDSVLMGIQITKILNADAGVEVVGRAKDGVEALQMVAELQPDVVTLDVEMPRMDGITALKHMMVRSPVPVIMLSSLTREGAKATFDALRFGAVDVLAKPSRVQPESLEAQAEDIITRVKQAAAIGTRRARYRKKAGAGPLWTRTRPRAADASTRFVGIGTGTGGYSGLLQVIPNLQDGFQDVLVAVMRVPSRYIEPFVAYLSAHSPMPVKNIRGTVIPETGTCYVCSCQDGAVLSRDGNGPSPFELRTSLADACSDAAIDTMFRSLAQNVGSRAVGVVMSGAGSDGAEGIAAIRAAGGIGVVQTISTCMNPSMPRAVLMKGTVEKVVSDHLIADYLMSLNGHGLKDRVASGPTEGAST